MAVDPGAHDEIKKQLTKNVRWNCILGICCAILLTANVVLLGMAWPCLTCSAEAIRCACPPVSAGSEHAAEGNHMMIRHNSQQFHVHSRESSSLELTENDHNIPTRRASASSSGEDAHKEHDHDAMLFLFNAIIIGVLVLHITTHPKLHCIQHTSSLFVLGMCYALVQEGLQLRSKFGVLGRSYSMWMDIDPHLILFTMLPALLAGDAMAIDTSIVKRVASQCMYLAGPGVIAGSLLTAGFTMLYLGWSFKLSLTLGAILAATDPVAVVSLLKQLGASPTLTVQIAGESLLNDGTAIVLYTMAYEMLQGETYDIPKAVIFIVRKALCAAGLGWVIGWVFVIWINAASNRFEHHSSTIQICLTLCCAYWSFIMAEGVLDMSGVLCTVAASLVLADKMWMAIVEKESMIHVWHTIEFVGNTLIFFLAGALTGDCMVHIPAMDYLHLLVLYAVSMLIRAFIIFGSRPILQYLSPERQAVSKAEALIMTVGGLRGAVGLALAIQVSAHKDGAFLDPMDARRVLFYTGGIATLTLVINASLCPVLVRACGLVNTDDVTKKMLLSMHRQMSNKAADMTHSGHEALMLNEMMAEVKRRIDAKYVSSDNDDDEASFFRRIQRADTCQSFAATASEGRFGFAATASEGRVGKQRQSIATNRRTVRATVSMATDTFARMFTWKGEGQLDCEVLVSNFEEAKAMFQKVHRKYRTQLNLLDLPEDYELKEENALRNAAASAIVDEEMMQATNLVFLSLVKAQYWHQIHSGEFIEGSSHPEVLLTSVAVGSAEKKLKDFEFILQDLGLNEFNLSEEMESMVKRHSMQSYDSARSMDTAKKRTLMTRAKTNIQDVLAVSREVANTHFLRQKDSEIAKRIVSSTAFNGFITVVILANVLNVFIEEGYKQDQSDDYSIWLVIEIVFNVIFIIEFVIKFAALRCAYFKNSWNAFDFLLVVLGIAGIILEIVWLNSKEKENAVLAGENNLSQEARVFRLNRVFRVMRLIRVFRLVKLLQVVQAKLKGNEVSLELAKHLRKITVLTSYARATRKSQTELFHYFGDPKHATAEQACCLLESQTNIFNAASLALCELKQVDATILKSLSLLRESGKVADSLSGFVHEAQEVGVVSAREAENLLAPIHKRRKIWHLLLHESEMGILRKSFDTLGTTGCIDMKHGVSEHRKEHVDQTSHTMMEPLDVVAKVDQLTVQSIDGYDSPPTVDAPPMDDGSDSALVVGDEADSAGEDGVDFTHPHSPLRTLGDAAGDSSQKAQTLN